PRPPGHAAGGVSVRLAGDAGAHRADAGRPAARGVRVRSDRHGRHGGHRRANDAGGAGAHPRALRANQRARGGGALVAELRKPAGSSVELGLETGSYVVTVEDAGSVREAQLTLTAGEHLPLARAAFHPGAPLEVAVARGDGEAPAASVSTTPGEGEPPHETTSFKTGFIPRGSDGRTDVDGLSFGFIADRAARLHGMQLSLGYNQIDAALHGLQLTVGANVAGSGNGAQISVGGNIARGDSQGAPLGAGANVVDGDFHGWQNAAGVNVTTGRFTGVQSAAGLNLADAATGLQLAAGANVARDFHGAQVGIVNVAGTAQGFRLGLLNAAQQVDGFELGV